MRKFISSNKSWLWLVCLLVLFISLSYLVTSPKPKAYPEYDSSSPAPNGMKALYTYLGNAEQWQHKPALLTSEQNGQLMILIEPYFIPNSTDMKAYTDFIEAGNNLLLVQTNPDGMFRIQTNFLTEELDGNQIMDNSNDTSYNGEVLSTIRLAPSADDEVLLSDQGGPIALKRTIGEGNLFVANTPNWFTNENVLDQDHLPLVLSLIEEAYLDGGSIYFDEYVHGSDNAATINMLYPKVLLVFVIQVILLTSFWLWYRGKRFGAIFEAREETVRFSDERLRALAAWYSRGQLYHESIVIQATYLKYVLQEQLGIAYHKPWLELADQLEKRLVNISAKDVQSFTAGLIQVLAKDSITKQEFILWTKKIDWIRKEVEQDEKRTNILNRKI